MIRIDVHCWKVFESWIPEFLFKFKTPSVPSLSLDTKALQSFYWLGNSCMKRDIKML